MKYIYQTSYSWRIMILNYIIFLNFIKVMMLLFFIIAEQLIDNKHDIYLIRK